MGFIMGFKGGYKIMENIQIDIRYMYSLNHRYFNKDFITLEELINAFDDLLDQNDRLEEKLEELKDYEEELNNKKLEEQQEKWRNGER